MLAVLFVPASVFNSVFAFVNLASKFELKSRKPVLLVF